MHMEMGMKWLTSEVTERREFYVYLLYLTIKFHEIDQETFLALK